MAHTLVIEDEPLVRAYLRALLAWVGHTTIEAGEGEAGLRALERTSPDLVLCDLFMPGREGIETIRDLRRRPRLPIVAMTGGGEWSVHSAAENAVALGADLSLAKPIAPAVLFRALAELLDGAPLGPLCPQKIARSDAPGSVCQSLSTCPPAGSSVSCGARKIVSSGYVGSTGTVPAEPSHGP